MKRPATKGKITQLGRSRLAHRASGPSRSYLQTRIRGSRLYEAAHILAIAELSRRLHQAYEHAYDKQAADKVLPQNSGATEQKLTPDQGALVWNTLQLARKALISTSCRKYVGEGAYTAMGELWDSGRYTYFHGMQARQGGEPAWASHGPGPGLFPSYRTVLFYPFFDDATINNPRLNGAKSLGIDAMQFRAVILLHEARHALCPGCKYAEDHDAWNADIVKNCFK